MKLIDALRQIKSDSNKIAKKQYSTKGYRYSDGECKLYDMQNQFYIPLSQTIMFYAADLFEDGWEVVDAILQKYKIGDRFILSDLYYSETKTDGLISNTTLKNTIGEIIASYYDGEKIRYTVSLNGKGFPLLLTEDYLNKLDMVVSQNE